MHNTKMREINITLSRPPRLAIIASSFNEEVVNKLLQGAKEAFNQYAVPDQNISIFYVPGAYELPLAAQELLTHFDGCIALGAVIRGETPHFDYVAGECASGLMRVSLDTRKPVIFGVLTTDTLEQALDRAGGEKGNKGFECAVNLLEMLQLLEKISKL